MKGDKSVLDAVLADASDFRGTLGSNDQRKLDEYLDSVRDVETAARTAEQEGRAARLEADAGQAERAASDPMVLPQDIAEHMRLMADILVLAFQTDATRVCTLKLNNDHSSLRFPHLWGWIT